MVSHWSCDPLFRNYYCSRVWLWPFLQTYLSPNNWDKDQSQESNFDWCDFDCGEGKNHDKYALEFLMWKVALINYYSKSWLVHVRQENPPGTVRLVGYMSVAHVPHLSRLVPLKAETFGRFAFGGTETTGVTFRYAHFPLPRQGSGKPLCHVCIPPRGHRWCAYTKGSFNMVLGGTCTWGRPISNTLCWMDNHTSENVALDSESRMTYRLIARVSPLTSAAGWLSSVRFWNDLLMTLLFSSLNMYMNHQIWHLEFNIVSTLYVWYFKHVNFLIVIFAQLKKFRHTKRNYCLGSWINEWNIDLSEPFLSAVISENILNQRQKWFTHSATGNYTTWLGYVNTKITITIVIIHLF